MANPSKYNRKLGFERLGAGTANGFNELSEDFALAFRAWGARRDVSDAERWAGGDQAGLKRSRFVIRSNANARTLTSDDRLVLNGVWDDQGALQSGEVWEITGIKEVAALNALSEIEISAQVRSDGA